MIEGNFSCEAIFNLFRYSGNLNPNASYLSASSSIVKYRRVMGNIVANRSLFSSSYIGHYPRNEFTEDYLVEILEKKIELAESKGVGKAVIEGGIHATIVKMGLKSDRIKGKLIRFVGALGYTSAAETLFLECSTFAGVGVCNALIAALGIGGRGAEAINVLHHMPNKLVKTETTYWNVLVACSHSGEAKAANYILGKIYKKLSMEPAIHHVGTYIDALARKGELVHAVREVKCLLYTPNREIIVSILGRCQPTFFDEPEVAKAFAKYLESKGISYRIQKSLYRELGAIGVQWGSNVKILRQRRIGGSSPN
ncbi:unnamed protein product [Microthlaspi erraticum]|uniref:Pentacotripeptide-repeat region of PRORP domain-containing protein n=1 Tax=Microthlaspi erraticum TaxID=1685480 RepID=A0A6D2KTD5_9BRAS|nr:unnamed protein product [Microthlaspi erraticum]